VLGQAGMQKIDAASQVQRLSGLKITPLDQYINSNSIPSTNEP
jgi:hypothetical protein